MNYLRRTGLALFSGILGLSLVGLAWAGVLGSTIRNPDTVKEWLEESGFYSKIASAVIDSAEEDTAQEGQGTVDVSDPKIQEVIDRAFDQDMVRNAAEKILDGVYAWLEGRSDSPEFSVDISEARTTLAEGLGNYATERAAGLPVCTTIQPVASGLDVLNASCIPPGVAPAQVGNEVKSHLLSSNEFLPDDSLDSSEVLNQEGKEVLPSELRDAYQRTRRLPFVLAVASLLSAFAVVFLSSTRPKGLWRAGLVFIGSSIVIGVSAMIAGQGTTRLSNIAEGGGAGAELVVDIAKAAGQDIATLLWRYAIGFVVVGGVMIFASKMINKPATKNLSEDKPASDPEPPVDESPKQIPADSEKPKPEQKQPKAPPKIQL